MLLLLVVENYAVVERLRVLFHPGLNLLTGETGSGKSIVVDALGLLLGGRASADMIRTGEPQARVAGIFDVRDNGAVRKILEPAGPGDGRRRTAHRARNPGQRQVARLRRQPAGGRRAAARTRSCLADIHGQHEQQLLFSADAQRDLLDAFAGNAELADRRRKPYRGWRAAAAALEELESSEQEKLRALDLWTFQRREIESAAVRAGRRRGARARAARVAERAAPGGSRGHGVRRAV
jgi:DNA repair protein RecN (Recombination protein N)